MPELNSVYVRIINKSNRTLYPHSFNLSWGKRFRWDMDPPHYDNPDHPIPTNTNLPPFGGEQKVKEFWFACCGKGPTSGVEGSIIISDNPNAGCVCKIYFDYPIFKANRIEVQDILPGYAVKVGGAIQQDKMMKGLKEERVIVISGGMSTAQCTC